MAGASGAFVSGPDVTCRCRLALQRDARCCLDASQSISSCREYGVRLAPTLVRRIRALPCAPEALLCIIIIIITLHIDDISSYHHIYDISSTLYRHIIIYMMSYSDGSSCCIIDQYLLPPQSCRRIKRCTAPTTDLQRRSQQEMGYFMTRVLHAFSDLVGWSGHSPCKRLPQRGLSPHTHVHAFRCCEHIVHTSLKL